MVGGGDRVSCERTYKSNIAMHLGNDKDYEVAEFSHVGKGW